MGKQLKLVNHGVFYDDGIRCIAYSVFDKTVTRWFRVNAFKHGNRTYRYSIFQIEPYSKKIMIGATSKQVKKTILQFVERRRIYSRARSFS